jgi:thiol-disulfide isomerase/thioredoxin
MITRRANRLRLRFVLVLFALPSLLFLHDRHAAFAASGLVGRAAPDAAVWNSKGFAAHLSALHGRPVWLNFFATWCAPCKEEMPRIEQRYRRYKNSGLVVVGVDEQESRDDLGSYARSLNLTFPIVIDDGPARAAYRVSDLPTSVFIDARGIIQAVYAGELTDDDMDSALAAIVR